MKNILKLSIVAVILSLGMILSSALLSKLFVKIRQEKSIAVKGYAEKNVVSDIGKFYCCYTTRASTLKESYEKLEINRKDVLKFIKKNGIKENEIEINNINTSKIYKKDEKGNIGNEIEYYETSQWITVTSENVNLIKEVSQKITELIREGIDIYSSPPNFYISKLNDIKVELISKATKDGYKRAQTLAKNSGGKVGSLSSARQGVFQITVPNSIETSDYGIYDTSTIEKTVKAVVTLEYTIE